MPRKVIHGIENFADVNEEIEDCLLYDKRLIEREGINKQIADAVMAGNYECQITVHIDYKQEPETK